MISPTLPAPRHAGLLLVALYEFTKGILLLMFAIGLLRMLDRDLQQAVMHWAHVLRLDLHHRFVENLAARAGLINPHELRQLSALGFFTGSVHLVQGVGLYLGKRWAEYLTVVATGAFIPMEVAHVVRHFGPVGSTVLLVNVALVAYLVVLLRRRPPGAPAPTLPAAPAPGQAASL